MAFFSLAQDSPRSLTECGLRCYPTCSLQRSFRGDSLSEVSSRATTTTTMASHRIGTGGPHTQLRGKGGLRLLLLLLFEVQDARSVASVVAVWTRVPELLRGLLITCVVLCFIVQFVSSSPTVMC